MSASVLKKFAVSLLVSEKVCPQHLHIRDLLADVAAEFEKKG